MMDSRYPTAGRTPRSHEALHWDVRGTATYNGKVIKRVFRQRKGFEYRIVGTKTVFDDLELVLEEIDYIVERMNSREHIG